MLTKRQKQILDFITDFIRKNEYSPSLEEIKRHFRLRSVATVHEHIEMLQSKRYLKKEENQPRSVALSEEKESVEIPLFGFIAAGEPIEAISNPEPIIVSKSSVSQSGLYYALKVKGNSMVNEGIYDGDTVLIRRQDTAERGQMVVALIDKNEVTLKKLYFENGKIRLQPANPKMDPIFIDSSRVIIQGVVIDIIKNSGSISNTSLVEQVKQEPINVRTTNIDRFINQVIEGDCLDVMKKFPPKSINMILCDLPYGTTQNHWDSVVPLNELWKHYERIIKNNGVIVLTSQGLFTAQLILSNPKLFKYKITWVKSKPTNFLNSKKQPLRKHEDICIFYKNQPTYNPQMSTGKPYNKGFRKDQLTGSYGDFRTVEVKSDGERYPTDVVYFKTAESEGPIFHPTQKPVELGRYLIRTFTREGDLVLDNACGSGSFLVSAILEGRRFVGIEKNQEVYLHRKHKVDYMEVCEKRIKEASQQIRLL